MAGKILHLIIGVFVLAQCNHCAANRTEEFKVLLTSFADPTPRLQPYIFAMIGYAPLVKMAALNGTVVIRELLEETVGMRNPSEALKAELTKLTAFERRTYKLLRWLYSDEEMVGVAFELTAQIAELVEEYNAPLVEPSIEQLLLKLLLQKHGFEPLAQAFAWHFERFKPKFSEEIEKYFAGLSPAERAKESAMLAWFEQFQRESNFSNFVKFFDLYPVQAALTVQKYKMWRDAVM